LDFLPPKNISALIFIKSWYIVNKFYHMGISTRQNAYLYENKINFYDRDDVTDKFKNILRHFYMS